MIMASASVSGVPLMEGALVEGQWPEWFVASRQRGWADFQQLLFCNKTLIAWHMPNKYWDIEIALMVGHKKHAASGWYIFEARQMYGRAVHCKSRLCPLPSQCMSTGIPLSYLALPIQFLQFEPWFQHVPP